MGSRLWGDDVSVIPEYCFGVEVFNEDLELSSEHTEYRWLPLDAAINLLHWESNKAALRELDDRLSHETAE